MTKNVLITGSTKGIGRETAIKFANMGYNVIINGCHSRDELIKLETIIKDMGVRCISFLGDVGQFNKVTELFDILEKNNMIPDILINNAGISYIGLLQDMAEYEWQNIINTNLTSVFNCSKSIIPYMIHKKSGRIINISSMWGNVGASCEVAYSATKGGINAFTKSLAKELAPSGIQVNAIAFGTVNTKMNAFLSEEEMHSLIEEIPAGHICSPQEASEIVYSVATLPDYITGQIITADGGFL